MNTSGIETTSDERVMAAVAHLFGMLAALIIWATQKDKSRFIKFQALQAIAFDAVVLTVTLLMTFCLMGLMFAGMGAGFWMAASQPNSEDAVLPVMLSTTIPMLMFVCIMPLGLGAVLIRLIAAVSVASGRNFRYPLIAPRLDAFLANE